MADVQQQRVPPGFLLGSKLTPPAPHRNALPRRQLTERLDAGLRAGQALFLVIDDLSALEVPLVIILDNYTQRLLALDAYRGVILVLMAFDHASSMVAKAHVDEWWGTPLPGAGAQAVLTPRYAAPGDAYVGGNILIFQQLLILGGGAVLISMVPTVLLAKLAIR